MAYSKDDLDKIKAYAASTNLWEVGKQARVDLPRLCEEVERAYEMIANLRELLTAEEKEKFARLQTLKELTAEAQKLNLGY